MRSADWSRSNISLEDGISRSLLSEGIDFFFIYFDWLLHPEMHGGGSFFFFFRIFFFVGMTMIDGRQFVQQQAYTDLQILFAFRRRWQVKFVSYYY